MTLFRFLSAVLVAGSPLSGWNAVGHRVVAGLAYDQLSPAARARADELIRRHPDFPRWIENGPEDSAARMRHAFMKAAVWADVIKGDPRFYNEARPDAQPTPTLSGFPDMRQHRDWHYINVPFSTDGTPTRPPPQPNVLTQVRMMISAVSGSPGSGGTEDPIYVLPWLLHLVGDIHQPLHCGTRFRRGQRDRDGQPMSDLGGNTVRLVDAENLHAFWDDALGLADTDRYVEQLITALKAIPVPPDASLDPDSWVEEGFSLSRTFVYSFGNEGGTPELPLKLPEGYIPEARKIARTRAAIAGWRLAEILNQRLK